MNLKFIKKTLGIALLSCFATQSMAQDLIARQAPVDRHMKNLNNVKIGKTITTVDLSNPAANFYTNWEHKNLRDAKGYVAANTKIDLRGFAMPTDSRKVTSNFGRRWGRNHEGLDIKVYVGDTIRAAFDGKVRISSYNARGYGYYILIRHPNGLETLYGHMSKLIATEDQIVRAGQPIGLGGNTGRSYGSHLHFETRICGTPINPALMFDFANQDVVSDYFVCKTSYGSLANSLLASLNTQASEDNTSEKGSVATTSILDEGTVLTEENTEESDETTKPTIRKTSKSKKKRANNTTYTIKKGDTLYDIAKRNGTTAAKIAKANGFSPKKTLHPGDKIKI